MTIFRKAHSANSDGSTAVRACLDQLGTLPSSFNLGFLYLTDSLAHEAELILTLFKKYSPIQNWVGTVGIGICSTNIEYYDAPAITVLVGQFPRNSYHIIPSKEKLLTSHPSTIPPWQLGVIHADPHVDDLPATINNIAERNGFLIGGLTSSQSSYCQIADQVHLNQINGVMFNEQVPLLTGLSQGCTLIGPYREITECVGNRLIEIDHRPALDVFYEDIGELLARDMSRLANYIFVAFPVKGSDTGDYLVRNLVGIDIERKIIAVGQHVSSGDKIIFSKRDAESARQDLNRMLGNLKNKLEKPPQAGLYYSCLGRGRNLFGDNSEELKTISDALGEFPITGFYCNGEIANNRLYGYTGILTLFT